LPFDGARGEWAETVRRWMVGETGYASEGAESFDDVRQRVLPIWNRLAEEYGSRTYVVVAHGAVITVVLLSLRLPLMAAGDLGCPNLAIHDLRQTQHGWTIGAPSEG
jgi:probable phosphoglycerate mutase